MSWMRRPSMPSHEPAALEAPGVAATNVRSSALLSVSQPSGTRERLPGSVPESAGAPVVPSV